MKVNVRFVGSRGTGHVNLYEGETLMEGIEVSLPGSKLIASLRLSLHDYPLRAASDPIGNETRREFAERLRSAARSVASEFEHAVLAALREQGHLV